MRQFQKPKGKCSINRSLTLLIGLFIYGSMPGQVPPGYSILVAGHAYGAHAGTNIGLHPPFLNKLHENNNASVAAVFLTGDIVNHSTTASWAQVANELSDLGLWAYYVMGNHDNNSTGRNIFNQKHGGTYYSITHENELFIVLNSTESDRSISTLQLQFLRDVLQNSSSTNQRVFIFFHEVIWNSHEKYRLVRSNSRSRYDQMVKVSNFWDQVFPALRAYPEKAFYLFAGDVGGNPDAIAASYDIWDNVSLLSSGMGEVADENYLEVKILPDTVTFDLIPLDAEVEMKPITWYNVPEMPNGIEGPVKVNPLEQAVRYEVSPVYNATAYRWDLGSGMSGISDSASISLHFDDQFQTGQIIVRAENDGFGESEPVTLEVQSLDYTDIADNELDTGLKILQNQQSLQVVFASEKSGHARLRIYNLSGTLLFEDQFKIVESLNYKTIDKSSIDKGIVILELLIDNKQLNLKTMLY